MGRRVAVLALLALVSVAAAGVGQEKLTPTVTGWATTAMIIKKFMFMTLTR